MKRSLKRENKMKEETLKPETRFRVLFKPLKKLCLERNDLRPYEDLKRAKGSKHDLICKTDKEGNITVPSTGFIAQHRDELYDIPSFCFKIIKGRIK